MNIVDNSSKSPKFLPLLAMLYGTVICVAAILAQFVGDVHGFIFTEGASVMPLMYFSGDIITEVYGYAVSRRIIWSALACVLFFMFLIMAMVHFPSPRFFHLRHLYIFMYDRFVRVVLCMAAFIPVSEFINSYILSRLKILWAGKWLWVRSLTSSLTGELVIAVLGNVILFAGHDSFMHLLQIIFASFAIKAVFSTFSAVPCAIIANIIKRAEGIDVYDHNISYNPFKF